MVLIIKFNMWAVLVICFLIPGCKKIQIKFFWQKKQKKTNQIKSKSNSLDKKAKENEPNPIRIKTKSKSNSFDKKTKQKKTNQIQIQSTKTEMRMKAVIGLRLGGRGAAIWRMVKKKLGESNGVDVRCAPCT